MMNQKHSVRKKFKKRTDEFLNKQNKTTLNQLVLNQIQTLCLDPSSHIAIYYPLKEEVNLRHLHKVYSHLVYPRISSFKERKMEWVFCHESTSFEKFENLFFNQWMVMCVRHKTFLCFLFREWLLIGRGLD